MSEYPTPPSFSENSPSVQTHLSILQGVVQRMASNSASCKTWCITTVSAILVIVVNKNNSFNVWIALFPAFMFFTLDVYYLSLEKGFVKAYKDFVSKLHSGELKIEDLYSVVPSKKKYLWNSIKSFSIWGFYFWIFFLIILIERHLKK